jgi:hypothetical protein
MLMVVAQKGMTGDPKGVRLMSTCLLTSRGTLYLVTRIYNSLFEKKDFFKPRDLFISYPLPTTTQRRNSRRVESRFR